MEIILLKALTWGYCHVIATVYIHYWAWNVLNVRWRLSTSYFVGWFVFENFFSTANSQKKNADAWRSKKLGVLLKSVFYRCANLLNLAHLVLESFPSAWFSTGLWAVYLNIVYVHVDEKLGICTSIVSTFSVTLWLPPTLPENYFYVGESRWK